MNKVATVNGIQSNVTKQAIRDVIDNQVINFAKQNKTSISLMSLPSTGWIFEKGLIKHCKENSIKLKEMAGVENSTDTNVFHAFEENAPKEATDLLKGDFDDFDTNGLNVVWADYCGNPAEATYNSTGKIRYSYTHINAFRDFVKQATKPSLYYMTFSCNGRILGGADNMVQAMSPNATYVYQAIQHKITQTLCTNKLSHKTQPVLSIYYHGSGKSFMVTIGFAINFKPTFSYVKENWIKRDKIETAKKGIIKMSELISVQKEAMKALCDKGWNNEKIAHALNTTKGKVSAVISWHKHRDSWQKV